MRMPKGVAFAMVGVAAAVAVAVPVVVVTSQRAATTTAACAAVRADVDDHMAASQEAGLAATRVLEGGADDRAKRDEASALDAKERTAAYELVLANAACFSSGETADAEEGLEALR
ncbi:hypothetical protein ACFUMH_03815 [Cellulomonas sp. NPDC057328]|uniref:hypothetical protein n=1 Tax=Cellulomonas sp. NPDC057328 TaxID=3346101 RepID=UPI003645AA77